MRFIVGVPVCNESNELFRETIDAIWASNILPSRVIIVDNGDDRATNTQRPSLQIDTVRPEQNLGCAGAWNLIHKLAGATPTIIINADLAVAKDTFEQMLAYPRPVALAAYGFGAFRIDSEIRAQVGDFDEAFWPVYWEDTDYRYRLKLAGIELVEWPIDGETIAPGRKLTKTGIRHGKDELNYQGWTDERLKLFHHNVEQNRLRYIRKWGGGHTQETFTKPFNGNP